MKMMSITKRVTKQLVSGPFLVILSLLTAGVSKATDTVEYEVTFDAVWSPSTHPTDFPLSPHFSGLIGGAHNGNGEFWSLDGIASDGMEQMAETGGKSLLSGEVRSAISRGDAVLEISGGGIGRSPGAVSERFSINSSHPLVTLVSMIAPSPDWFVGVAGLDMRPNGIWRDEISIDLEPYDAGTDSGSSFASPNDDTNPREPISVITGFPFENADPLGTFTFRLLTDLGPLQPGDANRDLRFDQLDIIQVIAANKYLTGQTATWGEGDWDGAPGGTVNNPPVGNGLFDHSDVLAALVSGTYLSDAQAATTVTQDKDEIDVTVGYEASTGELWIDVPADVRLSSISIDSATSMFTSIESLQLAGSFDNSSPGRIFKATLGGSFGSLSFGNVLPAGLSEEFLQNDLTIRGSRSGGGAIENAHQIFVAVPEPATLLLAAGGLLVLLFQSKIGRTLRYGHGKVSRTS